MPCGSPPAPCGCWLSLPFSRCGRASCTLPSGVPVFLCPSLLVPGSTGRLRAPAAAPGSAPTRGMYWGGGRSCYAAAFSPVPTTFLSRPVQGRRPGEEAWMKASSPLLWGAKSMQLLVGVWPWGSTSSMVGDNIGLNDEARRNVKCLEGTSRRVVQEMPCCYMDVAGCLLLPGKVFDQRIVKKYCCRAKGARREPLNKGTLKLCHQ